VPHLIVDGYNILHAWPELAALKDRNFQDARELLIAMLAEYAAVTGRRVTVVFDAGARPDAEHTEVMHGITLVYTGAGRSADAAIERLAYLAAPQGVTVATSDLLQRRLVGGKGQATISARELEQEVRAALRATERQSASGRQLSALARRVEDQLDSETRAKLERLRRGLPLDPPASI
jgi:predicted RNA-binding protein with PIN domain